MAGRVVEELRDTWVIVLVWLTVAAVYFVAAAPLWQAIAAAIAVMVVRVVVGLLLPVPGSQFNVLSVLTYDEYDVVELVCRHFTPREIAKRLKRSERVVRDLIESAMRKLDVDTVEDLVRKAGPFIARARAEREREVSEPASVAAPKWWERPIVRGTVTAGGLVGFAWTSYQISLYFCRLFGWCV